jgi:NAD-dependent SIR2 family protein deacetylase
VGQLTEAVTAGSFGLLVDVVAAGDAVILSGAGLSTESGIPDYRGPTGLARRATPMTYQTFTGQVAARRRYWARSYLGWRHIAHATPNSGHFAVAEFSRRGLLAGIITQNVDGLHQAAGAHDVIELHGGLDRVICLACRQLTDRGELDARLRAANPDFRATTDQLKPDGDAELSDAELVGFVPVGCANCGSDLLKPDVVFFGESVPRDRVETCFGLVADASTLLVLGSSLTVMSGLRFVRRAAAIGTPVIIVNQGATRGDPLAARKVEAPLGVVLSDLV